MAVWWESLSALQRVFTYFALPATFILIIQTVLILFGIGGHDMDTGGLDMDDSDAGGFDVDGGSGGLALLSIRGIVAFFSVGGWAGIVVAGLVASVLLSVTAAMIAGTCALYGVALLFKWASKLQSAGNISLKYAVGKTAKIYITVPGGKRGYGKVLLTFQGRFTECDAVSDTPSDLRAGTLVRVVGIEDEDTLIVTPIVEEKIEFEVNQ